MFWKVDLILLITPLSVGSVIFKILLLTFSKWIEYIQHFFDITRILKIPSPILKWVPFILFSWFQDPANSHSVDLMSVYQFLRSIDPESIKDQFEESSEEEKFPEFSMVSFTVSIFISLAIAFLLVMIVKIYFVLKKTAEKDTNSNSLSFTVNFQNYFDHPVINEITIHHADQTVPSNDWLNLLCIFS